LPQFTFADRQMGHANVLYHCAPLAMLIESDTLIIPCVKRLKSQQKTYVILLLLVSHEEADNDGNGIDLMQKLTLYLAHSSKIQQQAEVFRQVFALRTCILLQLQQHKMLSKILLHKCSIHQTKTTRRLRTRTTTGTTTIFMALCLELPR